MHPVLNQTTEISLCNQSQITQTPHTRRSLWIPQSLLTLLAHNNHLKPESHWLYRILHRYTECYMNNYKNLNRIRKHLVKHNTPAPYWPVLSKKAKHKAILLKTCLKPFHKQFRNLSNQSQLRVSKVFVSSISKRLNKKHIYKPWNANVKENLKQSK